MNDLQWLFHDKMRFRHQLASLGGHAQLTRCFSAVVELLVYFTLLTLLSIISSMHNVFAAGDMIQCISLVN